MTPVELVAKTKAVLDERGWCKGHYFDQLTGEVCLVGALIHAHSGRDDGGGLTRCHADGTFTKVYDLLGEITGMPQALSGWNDDVDRRRADVVKALDQAIEQLEEAA